MVDVTDVLEVPAVSIVRASVVSEPENVLNLWLTNTIVRS